MNARQVSRALSDVAGPETPLIKNAWYVAGLASEFSRTPMCRTILEQEILFYRTEGGSAVALQNRCAHRGFPLNRGALNGDCVVCGYHGMAYGPDGDCVREARSSDDNARSRAGAPLQTATA